MQTRDHVYREVTAGRMSVEQGMAEIEASQAREVAQERWQLVLGWALVALVAAVLLIATAAWPHTPPLEQLPDTTLAQADAPGSPAQADPLLQAILVVVKGFGGAVQAGEAFVAVVLGVVLLVLLLRVFGKRLHDWLPDDHWADQPLIFIFDTKPGGLMLNSLTSTALSTVAVFVSGTPLTPEVMLPVVLGAGGAMGFATAVWGWVKDYLEHRKAKKATGLAVVKTGAVLLLLTLPLGLQSCTHTQVWRASGETITALGETYAATGQAFDALLDRKLISVETYRTWAAFCDYWKPAYDEAFKQWLNGDAAAQERVAGVLSLLSAELAVWTARSAQPPDGGAP